jgi:hypothetical protein
VSFDLTPASAAIASQDYPPAAEDSARAIREKKIGPASHYQSWQIKQRQSNSMNLRPAFFLLVPTILWLNAVKAWPVWAYSYAMEFCQLRQAGISYEESIDQSLLSLPRPWFEAYRRSPEGSKIMVMAVNERCPEAIPANLERARGSNGKRGACSNFVMSAGKKIVLVQGS